MVGLAISYALGITGKLSGLVSSFTETERELVAVERCGQYIDQVVDLFYLQSAMKVYFPFYKIHMQINDFLTHEIF